jgi:hypothetical protein
VDPPVDWVTADPGVATPSAPAASQDEPAAAGDGDGQDFSAEARLIMRVVACTGDQPLPEAIAPKVVEAHCRDYQKRIEAYRKTYVGKAMEFLAKLRPQDLPTTVIYPFGGGDLLSALTTYPGARQIFTLSLEHAGDPRRIGSLDSKKLAAALAKIRKGAFGLLMADNSTSVNLISLESGDIPGQLAFFLTALAIHDYEPVRLRFFRVEPDGALHYLTKEDIESLEGQKATKEHARWKSPDFSVAFSNSELAFRKRGASADAPLLIHRHIAANLANDHLDREPGVLKLLERQGPISAMTKAASYLLWSPGFTKIRDYLAANMQFMISDSTGVPPQVAQAAGFEVEAYGIFRRALLKVREQTNGDLRRFFKSQPKRELPFRYGYVDGAGGNHLLVYRRVADGRK